MTTPGRRHDRNLLDALESMDAEPFEGEVWRVTRAGYDPLRGSTASGRWSPPGEFEVLYTSLEREGALAEIGYRLSLEPVWPSLARHEAHRIDASLGRVLRFDEVAQLTPLGINPAGYGSLDYAVTQAMAAAAYFLEVEGMIVPSARSPTLHLAVFLGHVLDEEALTLRETQPVDWAAWRKRR